MYNLKMTNKYDIKKRKFLVPFTSSSIPCLLYFLLTVLESSINVMGVSFLNFFSGCSFLGYWNIRKPTQIFHEGEDIFKIGTLSCYYDCIVKSVNSVIVFILPFRQPLI